MASPIHFFVEFSSPYTYIAAHKVEAVGERHGRTVEWKAVSLAHVWRAIDYQRTLPHEKASYMLADWTRYAALEGLPIRLPRPFPVDAKLARLVFWRLQAQDAGLARRFALGILDRYWGEGQNIQSIDELAGLAEGLRIDRSELEAAGDDQAAKQRLIEATDLAVASGMFGAPFFVVDGEAFWGADRLDHLDRWLTRQASKAA